MPDTSRVDQVLRRLPAPVAVVGAARDGVLGGLTAAWLTRVSLEPPLIVVAVARERFTWGLLPDGGEFTISLLAEGQVAEARLFGLASRREVDKWARVGHVRMGAGAPALADCCARLLCRVEGRFPTGDHDCFVGRILEAENVSEAPPLPLRGEDYVPGEAGA